MPASRWLTLCVVKCRLTKEGDEAMRMAMTWMIKKGEEVSGKCIEETSNGIDEWFARRQ